MTSGKHPAKSSIMVAFKQKVKVAFVSHGKHLYFPRPVLLLAENFGLG